MDEMAETIAHRENANGVQAFVAVGRFLEAEGWHPRQLEDAPIYQMGFSGESGPITCYAQVRVEEEILLCYAVAPVQVEEEARPAVAEFVTRANYGLWVGNFEMDWDDGEVRYKSSLDFEGVALTPALIRNTISPVVQMMVCYLPGLVGVMAGKLPAQALSEVDADCNCGE
jgi:hypothetical protein